MKEFVMKYKKWLVTAFFLPLIVSYMCFANIDKSYWLTFFGGFLAFYGTFFLGLVSLWQNEKLQQINEDLLALEESKYIPFLHVDALLEQELTNYNLNSVMEICVDDSYIFLDEDLNVKEASRSLFAVKLINTKDFDILSIEPRCVSSYTTYNNGVMVNPQKYHNMRYSSNSQVCKNGSIALFIAGIEHSIPPNISEEEMLQQDYCNPRICMCLELKLLNNTGRAYTQIINFELCILPSQYIFLPVRNVKYQIKKGVVENDQQQ